MFDLLFLRMYWKHGELKKTAVQNATIHDLNIYEHFDLLEK